MTPDRHPSAVVTFPNDLEIVVTREYDATGQLVFDNLEEYLTSLTTAPEAEND